MNTPYLLIVLGPTASGKLPLPSKVINTLKLNENYVPILIDELVENNPYYKHKVNIFINEQKKKGETK